MPIDFAPIAEAFREPFSEQTARMAPVFLRLKKAVERWDEQARLAERATRAYPVLRYVGDALAVRVDTANLRPFAAPPSVGLVEGLRAGGRRFVAEVGWIGTALEQELALPRMARVGAEALTGVAGSIERFRPPSPSMFDVRERRAEDVFGLLFLGMLALRTSEGQLVDLVMSGRRAAPLMDLYDRLLPDPAEYAGMPKAQVLSIKFQAKSRTMMAAILLLPAISEALAVLTHDGTLYAKRLLLTKLSEAERSMLDFRASAVDALIHASQIGIVAYGWFSGIADVVWANALILSTFMPGVVRHLLDGVQGFAEALTAWGAWLTDAFETARAVVEAFMGFDVMPFILALVFPPWVLAILPSPPELTIDDLVSLMISGGVGVARGTLLGFLAAADGALWLIGEEEYRAKVQDLAEVFRIVLTPRPFTLPADLRPGFVMAGFPDLSAPFGGSRGRALLESFDRLGLDLRRSVEGTLAGATDLLEGFAGTVAGEAERSASFASPARIRGMIERSRSLADEVFGGEQATLEARIAGRRPDELGAAFERAVAEGGIAVAGAAIPIYVGRMRRFWGTRRAAAPRPTSPHILARHGRLGVVRCPRMTMRVRGGTPDAALATLVATRFRDQVGEVYRLGRREFVRLGGST